MWPFVDLHPIPSYARWLQPRKYTQVAAQMFSTVMREVGQSSDV